MPENSSHLKYKRQQFLLAIINELRHGVTTTNLHKLVFLLSMQENLNFYEFVPYKYGAYSFQLTQDLDTLARLGYISKEQRIKALKQSPIKISYTIARQRGDQLIRRVYREYPFYALNSEIVERLFCNEELIFFKNQRSCYFRTEKTLFTIGYEGRTIEAFVNILLKNDVRLLCDVRKNPISRKFGFSKGNLSHIIKSVGIDYIHLPELGIDSKKRILLKSQEDFKNLFDEYAAGLSQSQDVLNLLASLLSAKIRIALMCFEKEASMCHRHIVADYLADTYEIRNVNL